MAHGGCSYFEGLPSVPHFRAVNTKFANVMAFAPSPKEFPFFTLTLSFPQAQVSSQGPLATRT